MPHKLLPEQCLKSLPKNPHVQIELEVCVRKPTVTQPSPKSL